MQAFHSDFETFPLGNAAPVNRLSLAGGWWSFQVKLLPYLESKNIYEMCNVTYQGACFDWIAIQPPQNNPAVMINAYNHCPDDPHAYDIWHHAGDGAYGCTNYLGCMGTTEFANDGILLHGGPLNTVSLKGVTDGASHTIIMGERGLSDALYGWPYCGCGDDNETGNGDNLMATNLGLSAGSYTGNDDYHYWSYHPNLAQFLWADGHAIPITNDIDFTVFQAISTRAGGEVVQLPSE